MKALQTLTELDEEVNEENAKKLKELQSEIKQLEGMMGKLDGKKKVKEGTKTIVTTAGNDEEQAIQSDPTIKNKQAAVRAVKNAAPGTSVVVPTTGN
jgi:NCAIR mutase (PurE)-related protein